MTPRLLKLWLCSAVCLSLAASAGPPAKRRAWITISDAAFRLIQTVAPDIVSIASRQVGAAGASEKVHAVVLDQSRLVEIAGTIHERLGQCGGFMYHASEAQARAALNWRPAAAPAPAPLYGIHQRALVEPILAGMQEKHIASTIVTLSEFPNRYYASQSGVDASNWLLARWRELAAGRDDISVAQLVHKAYPQASVTLTIAGTDLADEKVVSAHTSIRSSAFGWTKSHAHRARTTTLPALPA